MGKRKVIKSPIDLDAKLNASGQKIVEISLRQLEVLQEKMVTEALDDKDIRKLESLSRIVSSQQKHRVEIEKMQRGLEDSKDGEVHNHLHVTEEQLNKLSEMAKKDKGGNTNE